MKFFEVVVVIFLAALVVCHASIEEQRLGHPSNQDRRRHSRNRRPFLFDDLQKVDRNPVVKSNFHLQHGVTVYKDVPVKKDFFHKVTFAVKQRNTDKLHDILMSLSDPASSNYGNHWSKEKIAEFTSSPGAVDAIHKSLHHHGIEVESVTKHGEYITAVASIGKWEEFFGTKFHHVHDEINDKVIVRAMEFSLPSPLNPFVSGVFGVSDYFVDRSKISKLQSKSITKELLEKYSFEAQLVNANSKNTNKKVSTEAHDDTIPIPPFGNNGAPWCVDVPVSASDTIQFCLTYPQLLYNIYNSSSPYGSSVTTQAVFSAYEYFSPQDLEAFQQAFNLTVMPVAGGYNGHVSYNACADGWYDCTMGNADVQYITAMAQGVPTYYDYFMDNNYNDYILDWILTVANMTNPPNVFSISFYGYENYMNTETMMSFNTEAMKLGIQGVTLVANSGDQGAVGYYAMNGYCSYFPLFPAVSLYVTTVGATQGPETGSPEIACMQPNSYVTSGGGFSAAYMYVPDENYNYVYTPVNPVPSYQKTQVNEYLVTQGQFDVLGYGTGRGYPDISMLGNNFFLFNNNTFDYTSGTSVSANVFAGVISQANNVRKEAGLSSLGFVNPLLYQYSSFFVHDVTQGNNKCISTYTYNVSVQDNMLYYYSACCLEGFTAAPGWDPVTGLGSIDVNKFIDVATTMVATDMPTMAPTFSPPVTAAMVNFETSSTFFVSQSDTFAMDGTGNIFMVSNYSQYVWQANVSAATNFSSAHWYTKEQCPDLYCFYADAMTMSTDGMNRFVGGLYGGFYSKDAGQTWTRSHFNFSDYSYIYYAAASDDNQVIITADYSMAYISHDYGATFPITVPANQSSEYFAGVGCSPNGQLLAIGLNYGMIFSSDGGQTWYTGQGLVSQSYIDYSNIVMSNDMIIVSPFNTYGNIPVYMSTDGGHTFEGRSFPPGYYVYAMSASSDLSRLVIYMYSYIGSMFYVSNNYGTTFDVLTITPELVSAGTYYAATSQYGIKTFDVENTNATNMGILLYNGGVAKATLAWDYVATPAPSIQPTTQPPSPAPTTAVPSHEPSKRPSATPTEKPSHIPTPVPTYMPSAIPTVQTVPVLTFTSTLQLNNVYAELVDSSYVLSPEQLISMSNAAAVSMSLVPNQVSVLNYNAVVPTVPAPHTQQTKSLRSKAVQQTSSLTSVTAELSTSLLVLPGQDAQSLYTSATTALSNAVDVNGLYVSFLQVFAQQEGVASTFAQTTTAGVANNGSQVTTPVTDKPTTSPTMTPSEMPSIAPTVIATGIPSITPTMTPSMVPSLTPSVVPTVSPSASSSVAPSVSPSVSPSMLPTALPSLSPSLFPTTYTPSSTPITEPTAAPTESAPSFSPTAFVPASSTTITVTKKVSSGAIAGGVIGGLIGLCLLLACAFYSGMRYASDSDSIDNKDQSLAEKEQEMNTFSVQNPAMVK